MAYNVDPHERDTFPDSVADHDEELRSAMAEQSSLEQINGFVLQWSAGSLQANDAMDRITEVLREFGLDPIADEDVHPNGYGLRHSADLTPDDMGPAADEEDYCDYPPFGSIQ